MGIASGGTHYPVPNPQAVIHGSRVWMLRLAKANGSLGEFPNTWKLKILHEVLYLIPYQYDLISFLRKYPFQSPRFPACFIKGPALSGAFEEQTATEKESVLVPVDKKKKGGSKVHSAKRYVMPVSGILPPVRRVTWLLISSLLGKGCLFVVCCSCLAWFLATAPAYRALLTFLPPLWCWVAPFACLACGKFQRAFVRL